MAIFSADSVRTMALELKRRVYAINVSISPLLQSIKSWTIDNTDNKLPTPFEVKTALQQFRAIRLDRLRLDDLVDLFGDAKVDDTIMLNISQEVEELAFQGDILAIQVDDTLDPGATPGTGDRYILTAVGDLHANFGTITKDLDGSLLDLGNNDIVQFNGAEFRIAFDASETEPGATIWNADTLSFYRWLGGMWLEPIPASAQKYSLEFIETDWVGEAAPYTITVFARTHALGSTNVLIPTIWDADGNNAAWTIVNITVDIYGTVIFSSPTKFVGHLVIM